MPGKDWKDEELFKYGAQILCESGRRSQAI